MKQAKKDGKDAYISVDKLYIDGVQYTCIEENTTGATPADRAGSAVYRSVQDQGQSASNI